MKQKHKSTADKIGRLSSYGALMACIIDVFNQDSSAIQLNPAVACLTSLASCHRRLSFSATEPPILLKPLLLNNKARIRFWSSPGAFIVRSRYLHPPITSDFPAVSPLNRYSWPLRYRSSGDICNEVKDASVPSCGFFLRVSCFSWP